VTGLEVVAPGPQTLVEDLGRTGWAALGVGRSGAFDRASLRLANRLVGNREEAPALETVGGGLTLAATGAAVVAVSGADGPLSLTRRGRTTFVSRRSPLHLEPGDVLRVEPPSDGLRSYVALRGGVRAPAPLGSSSRDVLAAIGPEPLAAGDVVASGTRALGHPHIDHAPHRSVPGPLHVLLGPRQDWFTADAVRLLLTAPWVVTPRSNRVGVRLEGPPLARRHPAAELPSEPVVPGAIQVPADGQPVVLGPDAPTTGGYPVIAVVVDSDLDRLAHVVPGQILDIRATNTDVPEMNVL
jgi:biotin-dependent carboxylase-like uncharacterized protein